MIVITLVFALATVYEMRYLKHRQRKKRTYWIVGGWLLVSYGYLMAVRVMKDFPTINKLLETVLGR